MLAVTAVVVDDDDVVVALVPVLEAERCQVRTFQQLRAGALQQ